MLIKLNKFNILIIIGILLLATYFFFKMPLREGVVFTPYDNSTWFVKPWDNFCIQTPPSCKKENINYLEVEGNPQIGCWCNDKQKAPVLDNNCTDLEFDPFIEYRR